MSFLEYVSIFWNNHPLVSHQFHQFRCHFSRSRFQMALTVTGGATHLFARGQQVRPLTLQHSDLFPVEEMNTGEQCSKSRLVDDCMGLYYPIYWG